MRSIQIHFNKGRLGKDPSFDWYFGLSCFAVALALVALADAALYSSLMSAGSAPVVEATASQAHISRTDIQDVAAKLRAKQQGGIAAEAGALRDPSGR